MNPIDVVKSFYDAFSVKDGGKMASLYDDAVEFSDPVFPHLRGEAAKAMWKMLCAKGKDLRVEYKIISVNDSAAEVEWNAWYTFASTGRAVHNRVSASFTIRNGKIIRHVDRFSFWRWSSQALGPAGVIFGWTPIIQIKAQRQASKSLNAWMRQGNEPFN